MAAKTLLKAPAKILIVGQKALLLTIFFEHQLNCKIWEKIDCITKAITGHQQLDSQLDKEGKRKTQRRNNLFAIEIKRRGVQHKAGLREKKFTK